MATTNNPGFSTDLNVTPSGFEVGDCLGASRFKGWIDDLTVANRAFSASEVTNLMNQVYPTVPVANPTATVNLLPTNTALTLAQIPDRTGFARVEYLSVAFKRRTGVSPDAYRSGNRAWREGDDPEPYRP